MYTFMSINGSSGSCHPRRDAELIPICNRLLTDLHVVRKMKCTSACYQVLAEPVSGNTTESLALRLSRKRRRMPEVG